MGILENSENFKDENNRFLPLRKNMTNTNVTVIFSTALPL